MIKICLICFKEFESIANNQKYCSKTCSNKYHENKRTNKTERNLKKRKEKIIKICEVCNKEFMASRIDKKYCSDKCFSKKHNSLYRERHSDKLLLKSQKYYENNKEEMNKKSRQYYQDNKDTILIQHRAYDSNSYEKDRRQKDMNFRLRKNLRSRIRSAIINQSGIKAESTILLLGCSVKDCRQHLESKFQNGMSWENYGEWEIDHIIPCASFDLTKEEEQKKCFHYTNLQPLWWLDNITKGDKHDGKQTRNNRIKI